MSFMVENLIDQTVFVSSDINESFHFDFAFGAVNAAFEQWKL